jgi:hypothetical protein
VSLAAVQRGLRDLVLTGSTSGSDAYFAEVRASDRLRLLRDVVLWWRTLGVQRGCPLTSRLLMRLGRLEHVVSDFVATQSIPPYIEDLSQAFVTWLGSDDDPLLAAVARFESGLMRVKRGDQNRFVVEWPAEPYAVLGSLLENGQLPETGGRWWTVASAALPRQFEVRNEPPSDAVAGPGREALTVTAS